MKRCSIYCCVLALLTLVAVSCSEDSGPVDAAPSQPRGVSLSLTVPSNVTEGKTCKILMKAMIEQNIFEIVYPDYPDTFPENRVDTMETLFVMLRVPEPAPGAPQGMKIIGDSTRIVTPIEAGRSYDFEFEAEALPRGQWRFVAEAFYLDTLWQLPPHYTSDYDYRWVWKATDVISVESSGH